MAAIYNQININKKKTFLVMFFFFVFVILTGFVFAQIFNNSIILIIAVLFSSFSAILSWWHSDKIILKISKAKPLGKKDNPLLYNIVENLCISSGLPQPKIYIIEEEALNAFATGRNPEHGVVCVTRGLLENLDKSELEGVIAHELSHIQNYDTRLMTIATVLVGSVALLSDWFLRWSFFGGRNERREGNAILFLVGLILALLAPLTATLIQLAISRKREFLADASAALLTRYPQGLARALEKISLYKKPLRAANKATAHLYIVNPFKEEKERKVNFWTNLFSTHPSLEERIDRLKEMAI